MVKEKLLAGLEALGVETTPAMQTSLLRYIEILTKWNKVYNLTAISDPVTMVSHHVLDSLSINLYLHGDKIIDVGSGAGLPGALLAIINPGKQFVLIDSNGKKTRFLLQLCQELALENTRVVHARVEAYQPTTCFDENMGSVVDKNQLTCSANEVLLDEVDVQAAITDTKA